MKTCTACGKEKNLDEFYIDSRSKTGARRNPCIACRVERVDVWRNSRVRSKDTDYRIRVMAEKLLQRVKYGKGTYEGVKCLIGDTVDEVIITIRDNFYDDIKTMLDKGEIPSIDRIDSSGDYELANIRIVTKQQNSADGFRSANKQRMKPIEVNGIRYDSLAEASEALKIDKRTLKKSADTGKPSQKHGVKVAYI